MLNRRIPGLPLLLTVVTLSVTVARAQTPLPVSLPVNMGSPTLLTIASPQKQAAVVLVESDKIDIVVSVTDGAGKTYQLNSPLLREGIESFVIEPESGSWQLSLSLNHDCPVDGNADISIRTLEPSEIEAESAYQAGTGAFYANQFDEAARQYRLAAVAFVRSGQARQAADSLFSAGIAELRLAEFDSGRTAVLDAIDAYTKLGLPVHAAWAVNELGMSYDAKGQVGEAQRYFEQAKALFLQESHQFGLGVITNNLCLIAHRRYELTEAVACYEKALEFFRQSNEVWEIANTLRNIGAAWYMLGEPQMAQTAFDSALLNARLANSAPLVAEILKNVAQLKRSTGQYEQALELYLAALVEFRTQNNSQRIGGTLSNIGYLYEALGDTARAREYYLEALPIRRKAGDQRGVIRTLNHLGSVLSLHGDAVTAVVYHHTALDLALTIKDKRGESTSRYYLAEAMTVLGQDPRAEIQNALKLAEQTSDTRVKADALYLMAQYYVDRRDYQAALTGFLESAALRHAAGLKVDYARSLLGAAGSVLYQGKLDLADNYLQQAFVAIASVRDELLSPDLRSIFIANLYLAGELDIEIAMTRHAIEPADSWAQLALERAERHRMRTLGAMLQEAKAGIHSGIDTRLIDERDVLIDRLRLKADQQVRGTDAMREQLAQQGHQLLAKLDEVEARIRRDNAAYALLEQPAPATFAEMVATLRPRETVLQYALGKSQSWLWVYDRHNFEVISLPGREVIESAARKVYEHLSRFDRTNRKAVESSLKKLSVLVLPEEVESFLGDRIKFVADGALHFVPFAALSIADRAVPLIEQYEVVYTPSLTISSQHPQRPVPAQPFVTVFANPQYGPEGPAALAASAAEAAAIGQVVPPARLRLFTGQSANRVSLGSKEVAKSDILHIAAHGVFDAEQPRLSGLMLAADADDVGFVGLDDIYNLELNASLVVLSGCETAMGRLTRGEGLMGLTRGFLYAGAPAVMASLWQIRDRTTAELMAKFYQALLGDGLEPVAALRAAQLAMRSERRWRHPYFWAGLTLQDR